MLNTKTLSEGRIHSDYTKKILIIIGLKDLLFLLITSILIFYLGNFLDEKYAISWIKVNFNAIFALIIIFLLISSAIGTWYIYAYIERFEYKFTDTSIDIQSGVFTRKLVVIPYSRIQNFNIIQDILDRYYGLYTIEIETAGAPVVVSSAKAEIPEGYIPGTKDPNLIVNELRKQIRRRSGEGPDVSNIFFNNPDLALDHFVSIFLEKMKEGKEINNIIKTRREEIGMTQVELADKIGVTRQTIIQLEKGEYNPSLKLAFRIASALSVGVEQLFSVSEDDLDPSTDNKPKKKG